MVIYRTYVKIGSGYKIIIKLYQQLLQYITYFR